MILNLYTTNDMMKRINKFYYCILSLSLFMACQEEALMDKTAGFQISLQDGEVAIETKSTPVELGKPAVDKFKLKIVKEGVSEPLYEGAYTSQTISASAGTYTIAASYGDNPVLALDAPYYFGDTTKVVIKDGEKKSIPLKCKVANALASASFPADTELKKIFSSYWVKVVVGELSCKLTSDSKRSAYFQAGKQVAFYFEGKKTNGADFSEELKHKDLPSILEAGHNVKLTLKLSDDLLLDIAKVEVKKETITSDIPMDWLPRPKIEAEGFENNVLAFAETESKTAKLNLNTASALQDLKLKFTFGDPQFESLNDKEYLLSVPTDKEKVEKVLGIVLPEIGAEKASLDLTSIVSKLQTNAGTTVENKIEVDAKANNRWSSETVKDQENPNRVYTLRCNKPEMVVSVQPGNIWTKEFTVDELTVTAGNPEIIKSQLKYQYKDKSGNDDAWKEVQNMKVLFAEYPQNKSYQVRAVYRGAVMTDVVDVELENPEQLPNSGMEEWYTQELGSWGLFSKTRYYGFYPYSKDGSDSWWTTNNERSQDGKIILSIGDKVCFSTCVSYSESIKHEGSYSALIYTSGHGGGYASTGTILYPEGAFAGSLFIGKYSWSNGTETIAPGHTFSSRPSALKFYYNYVPKNTDTFKAYVELKNGEELVGSGTFTSSTSNEGWAEATVTIEYVDQPKEATSIYVQFLSTTKTSFSEGDFDKNKGITFPVMGSWNAHIGSMLYIDDLSLIYDK